jgi:flagellar basal-body rod protein FlgC
MMASVKNIFDVSGRAMAAQLIRLNTVASNLANSNNISTTSEGAYRPLKPIFETIYSNKLKNNGIATVDAVDVKALNREPERVYMPDHPKANEDGYVFNAAVNVEEEMVEMLEASRQYQNNIEVISTLRQLMVRTINLGK